MSSSPARRPDAFDQFFSRRAKQRLVVPDHTFGPESMPAVSRAGRCTCSTGATAMRLPMEVAVADLETRLEHAGLHAHPLGELR